MTKEKLMSEFPPVSTSQWEEVINKDLKGADYNKKLVWKTCEGISLRPYYREEDLQNLTYLEKQVPGEYPFVRGYSSLGNTWNIRQDIMTGDLKEANAIAKQALERGSDQIGFVKYQSPDGVKGPIVENVKELEALLNGLPLSEISIHFHTGSRIDGLLSALIEYYQSSTAGKTQLRGSIDQDPLGESVSTGKFNAKNFNLLSEDLKNLSGTPDDFQCITVSGEPYQAAGASISQEIALVSAAAVEYFHQLSELGLSHSDIAKKTGFCLSIGSDFFPEIAKFRAFRILWSHISAALGIPKNLTPQIHARTTIRNHTLYDHNVNILRNTTEAMSAILGGCNSLSILPHDIILNKPGEFSHRLARNTQLVLKHEAGLDRVSDPSGGSYYLETITDQLAESAWIDFTQIEEKGGFLKALQAGDIQENIGNTNKKRLQDFASGKTTMVGTNQFPDRTEKNEKYESEYSVINLFGSGKIPETSTHEFKPLQPSRLSVPLEKIRQATAEIKKGPVKVLLWEQGNFTMKKARSGFAGNFFACAGYKIVEREVSNLEDGLEQIANINPDIVVFCGADNEYLDWVPGSCKKLSEKYPPLHMILAGLPRDGGEMMRDCGIKDFIHIRTDMIEFFGKMQKILEEKQ